MLVSFFIFGLGGRDKQLMSLEVIRGVHPLDARLDHSSVHVVKSE